VACLNGGAFGKYGEGYIRFSYANSLDNLMEAMARIERLAVRWAGSSARGQSN
jgi:aspartate/methionine/tyrosine aminotransferase